jgi:hypothetical protein
LAFEGFGLREIEGSLATWGFTPFPGIGEQALMKPQRKVDAKPLQDVNALKTGWARYAEHRSVNRYYKDRGRRQFRLNFCFYSYYVVFCLSSVE